jgi:hypothetical protein
MKPWLWFAILRIVPIYQLINEIASIEDVEPEEALSRMSLRKELGEAFDSLVQIHVVTTKQHCIQFAILETKFV